MWEVNNRFQWINDLIFTFCVKIFSKCLQGLWQLSLPGNNQNLPVYLQLPHSVLMQICLFPTEEKLHFLSNDKES